MDDRSARFEDKIKNARSKTQQLRRTKTTESALDSSAKKVKESSGQRRRRKSDILSIMNSSSSSLSTSKKDRMDTDEIIKMLEMYASTDNAEALQRFHKLKMSPDEGLVVQKQQQHRQRSTRQLMLSPPKHANTSGAKTA